MFSNSNTQIHIRWTHVNLCLNYFVSQQNICLCYLCRFCDIFCLNIFILNYQDKARKTIENTQIFIPLTYQMPVICLDGNRLTIEEDHAPFDEHRRHP
jgi:hypothetical protein